MKFGIAILSALLLSFQLLAQALPQDSVGVKADSTNIGHASDSLTKLTSPPFYAMDSLKGDLARYNHRLDSVKHRLTHRIDSLNKLNLSSAVYKSLLDSLNKSGPVKDLKQAEAQMLSLENKLNKQITSLNSNVTRLESAFNSDMKAITKETGLALPNISGTALPATGNNPLPNVSLTQSQLGTQGANIRGTSVPGMPNLNAPQQEINQLRNNVELSQAQKELGQVQGYSKDLKHIANGDLDSAKNITGAIEQKATKMVDLKGFDPGNKALSEFKTVSSEMSTPQSAATQQLNQPAIDHFAGKEQVLQSAMSQVSKLKQKYSSLSSLKDIPKRVPNLMHGKPFIERFVPGTNLQFMVKEHFMTDFNPFVGYRFNGRLTAGAGWNQRIYFQQFSHNKFSSHNGNVYGPRAFADFKVGRGFGVRGEVEKMNAYVPTIGNTPTMEGSRQWIWGLMIGIKQEYKFFGSVRGTCMTLYNLNPINYNQSPYGNRFQVRIGFELPMKKKPFSGLTKAIPTDVNSIARLAHLKTPDIAGLKNLYKNSALLQYRLGKDTVTVTKGIKNKWKSVRDVYVGKTLYRFKFNKKLGEHEIYNASGKLLATTKKFREVTLPDGRIFVFFKMSDSECDYVWRGKEVIRARRGAPGGNMEIIWAPEAEQLGVLEMLCRLFLTKVTG